MTDINTCNFESEERHARKMSNAELLYAISDAQECVELGTNVSKYTDQISVYRTEINRRAKKNVKAPAIPAIDVPSADGTAFERRILGDVLAGFRRRILIQIAYSWTGHAGCVLESTTNEKIVALILDAMHL